MLSLEELLKLDNNTLLQHVLGSSPGSQQSENAKAILQQRSAEAQAKTANQLARATWTLAAFTFALVLVTFALVFVTVRHSSH